MIIYAHSTELCYSDNFLIRVVSESSLLLQLEEKQQSLSSIEAKMRESVRGHGDAVKEKDATIKSLQDQVVTL